MQSRRHRRWKSSLPALFFAALPLPALADERALSAWGPYLFLAIAVTLVVVLLLRGILEDDSASERHRDRYYGNAPTDRR